MTGVGLSNSCEGAVGARPLCYLLTKTRALRALVLSSVTSSSSYRVQVVAQRIKGNHAIDTLASWPFKCHDYLLAGQRDTHHTVSAVELQPPGGAQQVGVGAQPQLLAGLLELVLGQHHPFAVDAQAVNAGAFGGKVSDSPLIHDEVLGSGWPW